jgi:hypothetical protein
MSGLINLAQVSAIIGRVQKQLELYLSPRGVERLRKMHVDPLGASRSIDQVKDAPSEESSRRGVSGPN